MKPPGSRRRWFRALAVLLGVVALYLVGVNSALNTPIGPRLVNLRPRSARLAWRSAWSLWPGHLAVRGLEIHGQVRSRSWSLSIERASTRWGPFGLFARRLGFRNIRAEGVAVEVHRVPYNPPPGMKPTGGPAGAPAGDAPSPPLRTWKFAFNGIEIERLGTVDLFGLAIDCGGGRASGSFSFQIAGDVEIRAGQAQCEDAVLRVGAAEIARGMALDAEATLAPYSPRRHPGVEGFDFLSGRLSGRGMARSGPLIEKVAGPSRVEGEPAPLTLDLRVAEGALRPGSSLRLESRGGAPSLALTVGDPPEGTRLRVAAAALEVPSPTAGAPPLFSSAGLEFVGQTRERRISRLFAATRALRSGDQVEGLGLRGTLRVEAPRLRLDDPQMSLTADAERLSGMVDLAGLLTRQVFVEDLEIAGAAISLAPGAEEPPAESGPFSWTVALQGARLDGLREVAIGGDRLVGPFDVQLSAGFSPGEGFEIGRVYVAAPRFEVISAGKPVGRDGAIALDMKMAPVLFGITTARQALGTLSGEIHFAGRVESLAILRRFLQRLPTLRIDGRGDLRADLALTEGRLAPGSRLDVTRGELEARILESVARGSASLHGEVSSGPRPTASFDVRFPRYEIAPGDGGASYVRGKDLRVTLRSGDLALVDLVRDLVAKVTARGAEIPDLRVYDAYLPPGAGISLRSGSGKIDLDIDLDQSAGTANASFGLVSGDMALEFADVVLAGRLQVSTRLRSTDLEARRFDLSGTRVKLDDVALQEIGEDGGNAAAGWWAELDLASGSLDWKRPVALEAQADMRMKDTGFLLSVASRRKRFLSWFKGVLDEQDVRATAQVRIGGGAVRIDPLRAAGGKLDLRARMRMSKAGRRVDLFVRHGRLAAGLELRDGKRDIKIIRPEAWYESREGFD